MTANFSCPSASVPQKCRTLALLPCNSWARGNKSSTRNLENDQIVIYPNPVSTELTIELPEPGSRNFVLTDLTGAAVREKNSSEVKVTFDCTELNAGLYFIQIQSDLGILSTHKILINH